MRKPAPDPSRSPSETGALTPAPLPGGEGSGRRILLPSPPGRGAGGEGPGSPSGRSGEGCTDDPAACLAPGRYVDSDAPEVIAYAERVADGACDDVEKARRLYYAVRDDLRYDPYRLGKSPEDFRASRTLARGYGFCVTKAGVLAAVARAQGIPARLGFADVKNHLTSPRLRQAMGTDVFAFHGYTDLYLEGSWVKATPAFNRQLCEKAGVATLEFDGRNDSVYQAFTPDGRRHMEYIRYRGTRLDIPLGEMLATFRDLYGDVLEDAELGAGWQEFEDEVTSPGSP